MTKKLSLFLAALVAAIVGIGALLVPAQAAEKLGTARGWCVKSSTGELRTLRLTTAGKCQPGYWGPISLASGVKGPAGPAGPKGDKGDPGEGGTGVVCTAGFALKEITVANDAKVRRDVGKLQAALVALGQAKADVVLKESAIEAADAAIVTAQAAVDAATTVAAKDAALLVLADKVQAKSAAVNAVNVAKKAVADQQAKVDALQVSLISPETYTISTCVKG